MSDFFYRLKQFIDYQGVKSINIFAKEYLGYKSSEKINRLKAKDKNPSYDIITDIANKFENINLRWLLTGDGEMLQNSSKKSIENPEKCLEKLTNYIDKLEKENEKLKKENEKLKKEIPDEKCRGNLDVAKGAGGSSFKKEIV